MAHDMCKRSVFLGAQKCPQYIVDNTMIPDISAGQVLARIRLATMCPADVYAMQGKRKNAKTPSVLGHEGIAEIVQDERRNHSNLSSGDRITFSVINSCGECVRCSEGMNQKCLKSFKYGHSSIHDHSGLNGCFSSHIILHEGTHIVPLPDHITDKMAAPINCALATMVNAIGSCDHKRASQKSILIQGAGLLGIYGCALLHEAGFSRVFCSDPKVDRLKMVPLFGGTPVYSGKEGEIFQENDIDIAIEVGGTSNAMDIAMHLLKPGGTYILVGHTYPDSYLNITADNIITKCLTIKGIHGYAHRHLDQAVAFLSRTASKYPFEQLVGPVFSLNHFEAAVQEAALERFRRIALDPSIID